MICGSIHQKKAWTWHVWLRWPFRMELSVVSSLVEGSSWRREEVVSSEMTDVIDVVCGVCTVNSWASGGLFLDISGALCDGSRA